MPPYVSPKDLRNLRQDFVPDGDFILPICTNRERFFLMLQALQYFRSRTADHQNLDQLIDFLEAWAYLGNPQDSPCFPDFDTTREGEACVDYPTDATIISYAPQNPFTQPDYIPPGYIAVPFLVVSAGDPLNLLGFQVGDVLSGYLSPPILTPAIEQGLARFRVSFSGTGMVELHLIKIPGGGMALITHDDNPFTAQTVVLNKDIVQLPPETNGELIIEIPFETPGNHHIDVSFIARFNDELTFLTYGGGLRSVVLCGFDKTLDQELEERAGTGAIAVDTGDDEMRLRIDPDHCWIIQHECSPGVWETFYDPTCAGSSAPGAQPSPGGELDVDECVEYNFVLRGNERLLLPVPVTEGYQITISNAAGGWHDGNILHAWNCPNGQTYALGACVSAGVEDAGSPIPDLSIGRLIAQIGDDYYDAFNTTIIVPVGASSSDMYFQMNDASLDGNSGSVSFHIRVCALSPTSWERDYDLRYTTGFFENSVTPHGDDAGGYVASAGWFSTCARMNSGDATLYYDYISIHRDFDEPIDMRSITVTFNEHDVVNPSGDDCALIATNGAGDTVLQFFDAVSGDDQTLSWTGSLDDVTKIQISIFASYDSGACSSTLKALIKSVHIEGVGETQPA